MKRLLLILSSLVLANCASNPEPMPPATPKPTPPPLKAAVNTRDPNARIKAALGMGRSPANLGFAEKSFEPCRLGLSQADHCPRQVFTVIHFQLLCRDSEGSVSVAPNRLMPITARHVLWKLGGQTGDTQTDSRGYGQFTAISEKSIRDQRVILRIGAQFIGVTASDLSRIVLPKNFCRS